MYRIKRYEECPPGSYFFKILFRDGKEELWFGNGCKSTPNCYTFGPSPTIGDPARRLSAFRSANKLPRAGIVESTEDIDAYTCQRLGNASTWCYDTDRPYDQVNPIARPASGCASCGHQLS